MSHLYIKANTYRIVGQKIYESDYSVSDIAAKVGVPITEMYSILTGTRTFTFEQLIELAFYLDIHLTDLVECTNLALKATVSFFDRAIEFDRNVQKSYNQKMINDRMHNLINFIDYEFGRIAM